MPSPFPGMDPYIESQEWEDFHTTFNTVMREALAPPLEPRYIVRVERRVYVEHPLGGEDDMRRADVAVLAAEPAVSLPSWRSTASATAIAPVECVLPMPEERRETYLIIRERQTMEVVTVIETLSPANKCASSDGREQYLEKRNDVLESRSHLIELDLLRGGLRLTTLTPLPPADYYAIVSRRHTRPRAQVYAWTIRNPLQTVPVPLKRGDPEVSLDLQSAFTTVYDRARYGLSLNYTQPLDPPFSDRDAEWAKQLVEKLALPAPR